MTGTRNDDGHSAERAAPAKVNFVRHTISIRFWSLFALSIRYLKIKCIIYLYMF